jgi:hypothetical protein
MSRKTPSAPNCSITPVTGVLRVALALPALDLPQRPDGGLLATVSLVQPKETSVKWDPFAMIAGLRQNPTAGWCRVTVWYR